MKIAILEIPPFYYDSDTFTMLNGNRSALKQVDKDHLLGCRWPAGLGLGIATYSRLSGSFFNLHTAHVYYSVSLMKACYHLLGGLLYRLRSKPFIKKDVAFSMKAIRSKHFSLLAIAAHRLNIFMPYRKHWVQLKNAN